MSSVTNALEIGLPEFLSLTVTVTYDFSPILTGFFVNEYSTKSGFSDLFSQSTIPSNNDENFPPAISSVILQKLSPSVAIPSSPSKAAALPSPEVSMSTAALTFNGMDKNDNNSNNEKPTSVQPENTLLWLIEKWFRDNDFILFASILLIISTHFKLLLTNRLQIMLKKKVELSRPLRDSHPSLCHSHRRHQMMLPLLPNYRLLLQLLLQMQRPVPKVH